MKKVNFDRVMYFFREISQIPRCTRNEKEISEYLINFAKERGLEYYTDDVYNVIITREASEGMEDKPAYILQGHSDMVGEKASDSNHDFTKDPIEIIIEGDIMRANNTTLGADDGVAVAIALAILDDKELTLPRIEFLCTTQEEEGMVGAHNLKPGILKGKRMINIDAEEWGHIVTACAGGNTIDVEFNINKNDACACCSTIFYHLSIDGFMGGHSGIDINKPRVNAIVETFKFLSKYEDCQIADIKAPGKSNAISRNLDIYFTTSCDIKLDFAEFEKKCKVIEKNAIMKIEELNDNLQVIDKETSHNIIKVISNIPNGVYEMSKSIENMVETSLNVGYVTMTDSKLRFCGAARSSVNGKKIEISDKVSKLCEENGAKAIVSGDYPAWEFEQNNQLLEHISSVYEKEFGEKPIVEGIHAGLECAILKTKYQDVEMVAIGPDLRDVHTPKEIAYLSTVEKTLDYVVAILQA